MNSWLSSSGSTFLTKSDSSGARRTMTSRMQNMVDSFRGRLETITDGSLLVCVRRNICIRQYSWKVYRNPHVHVGQLYIMMSHRYSHAPPSHVLSDAGLSPQQMKCPSDATSTARHAETLRQAKLLPPARQEEHKAMIRQKKSKGVQKKPASKKRPASALASEEAEMDRARLDVADLVNGALEVAKPKPAGDGLDQGDTHVQTLGAAGPPNAAAGNRTPPAAEAQEDSSEPEITGVKYEGLPTPPQKSQT